VVESERKNVEVWCKVTRKCLKQVNILWKIKWIHVFVCDRMTTEGQKTCEFWSCKRGVIQILWDVSLYRWVSSCGRFEGAWLPSSYGSSEGERGRGEREREREREALHWCYNVSCNKRWSKRPSPAERRIMLLIFLSAKLLDLPSQVTVQRSEPQERLQWFNRSDVSYGRVGMLISP